MSGGASLLRNQEKSFTAVRIREVLKMATDEDSHQEKQNCETPMLETCSAASEDREKKMEFSQTDVNGEKSSYQINTERQKRRLFKGSLKLSKQRWMSLTHDTPTKKNRVLKSERSMDDAEMLQGSQQSDLPCRQRSSSQEKNDRTELDRGKSLDSVPEGYRNSFSDVLSRRGSICEEMEKEIVQGGISLHKRRKALVIEQTLKDRFLM
ncbi:uncharacterized protein LOC111325888 [Stylophora pistillata]|uniref:uncharacterized protein LOC111325888 n=1 Tax=Stylophora pistillata TaxID=50429 RepID=UPI000C03E6F5|nr:uncharacterized protein LOC111325888 [Stylophora pistillata]